MTSKNYSKTTSTMILFAAAVASLPLSPSYQTHPSRAPESLLASVPDDASIIVHRAAQVMEHLANVEASHLLPITTQSAVSSTPSGLRMVPCDSVSSCRPQPCPPPSHAVDATMVALQNWARSILHKASMQGHLCSASLLPPL